MIPARMRLAHEATAIRPFASGDLNALLELRRRNLDFMAPYEPTRSPAFYSRAGQARELDLDDAAGGSARASHSRCSTPATTIA